jgi:hypothetical protein
MDAWSDEGRVYLLDNEPGPIRGLHQEKEVAPERVELDGRMLQTNAVSSLLERGRFEAATALHACRIELEVVDSASYDDVPVWVGLKAPTELVFTLGNLDRDVAWFVREAISEALPNGYQASEFYVQALLNTTPYGGEGLAAA